MSQPGEPAARSAAPLVGAAPARLGTVVLAHPMVDAYAGFVPPLLGVLQVRCELSATEAAWLLSMGPIASGLSQPLFAWLTDRVDSRLFGAIGLALAAACLSSIGLATSFPSLALLFALGMIGVGAFHPVAAASVGQLAGRRRSTGVTVFFVAGMLGATAGPIISTRVTAIEPSGFDLLRWLMIPGVLAALLLHRAIRDVPHRHHGHRAIRLESAETRRRWLAVGVLFIANAMRYTVSIALVYLYVRWAEATIGQARPNLPAEAIARAGSLYCGELNALTMFGMGAGGLAVGLLVRPGREKRYFVLIPILLAPAIALFPLSGRAGGYGLALVAGVGYAAVLPLGISLAQRLLPHRTSLASGLMMGGAWSLALFAPPAAQWCLQNVGLAGAFRLLAGLLALSGVAGLLLPGRLIRRVAA